MARRRSQANRVKRAGVSAKARRATADRPLLNVALAGLLTAATSLALAFSRPLVARLGSGRNAAAPKNSPRSGGKAPMASHDHAARSAENAGSGSDIAPGDDKAGHGSVRDSILGYVIGLVLAAALTAASFVTAGTDLIYGPGIAAALIVFAIAQMGVHLVFFLHITSGPDNTNNIMALAFGVLIVFLLIAGSLWIMGNLERNMMPMDPIGAINQMPM